MMWNPRKTSPPPPRPTSTWEVPLNMKLSQAPVQDEPLDLSMKPKDSTSGQVLAVAVPPPTQNPPEVAAVVPVNEESHVAGASGDGNFKKIRRGGGENGAAEEKGDEGIWVPIKTRSVMPTPIHVEIESEPENEDLLLEQLKAGPSFSQKPQQLLQIVTEKPSEPEPLKSSGLLPIKKKKHPDLVMAEAYLAKYPESGGQATATASTSGSTSTATATATETPQPVPAPKKRRGKKFPEPFLIPKNPPNSPVLIVITEEKNPLSAPPQPQPIQTSMIETTLPQKRKVLRKRRKRTSTPTAPSSPSATMIAEQPAPKKKVRFSDDIATANGSDSHSAMESSTSSDDESGTGKKQKIYKPKPTITIGGNGNAAGGDKVEGGSSSKAASGTGSRPGYVAGAVEEHFQKSLGPLYQQFFNKNDGNIKTSAPAAVPFAGSNRSGMRSGVSLVAPKLGYQVGLATPSKLVHGPAHQYQGQTGFQGIGSYSQVTPTPAYSGFPGIGSYSKDTPTSAQTGFPGIGSCSKVTPTPAHSGFPGIRSCSQVTPTSTHFGLHHQGSTSASTIVQSQSRDSNLNLVGLGQGIDFAATAAFYFYYGRAVAEAESSFMKGSTNTNTNVGMGMGMPTQNPSAFSFNK